MKKNITMSIDEKLLKRARKAAIDKNKSLNSLIKEYLEYLAENEESNKNKIAKKLQLIFNKSTAVVGEKKWSRENLYER